MSNHEGLMIQAPTGSGKTWYITNCIPHSYKDIVIDGDDLLKRLDIKNRHVFWYKVEFSSERQLIIDTFKNYISKGYIIFYSGSPLLIKTDIIISPNKISREERLKERNEYIPTKEIFEVEHDVYETMSTVVPFCINGEIPRFELILAMYKELRY